MLFTRHVKSEMLYVETVQVRVIKVQYEQHACVFIVSLTSLNNTTFAALAGPLLPSGGLLTRRRAVSCSAGSHC